MARSKRTNRTALTGGKLALFEVLQAAQASGNSQLSDAVAPLSPAAPARERDPAPEPTIVVVQAQPVASPHSSGPIQTLPLEQAFARRSGRAGQGAGISLIGLATVVASAIAVAGAGLITFQHYAGRTPHAVSGSPPNPEVLDVGGTSSTPTYARPVEQTRTQAVSQGPVAPAVLPPDYRRVNGMNYVLVQSYHSSEEGHAIATRDALLKAGIGATIERGVPGWPNRLCVVGTNGFEQMRNNTKYQSYCQRLMDVSSLATAADKRIRKFEPTAVQWGRS